jgi:protein-disulfide isomerase
LIKEYDGKVRVVFKNLVVHPEAVMTAHLASCAAGLQGKFTEFKNGFWEKGFLPYAKSQGKDMAALSDDNMMAIAKELGLNLSRLKTDMGAPCQKRIADDMAEMEKFRVNATPAFFINGQEIIGGMDKEGFKRIIDAKLKIAEASGVPAKDYYDQEIYGKGEKVFRSKKDPKPAK